MPEEPPTLGKACQELLGHPSIHTPIAKLGPWRSSSRLGEEKRVGCCLQTREGSCGEEKLEPWEMGNEPVTII